MDRVLAQYKESKFFQEIVDEYHPLAIFLTGSRAIGIEHTESDYDLFLLVDIEGIPGPDYPDNLLQFIHKETGACIHYYTHSLQELFINKARGRSVKVNDTSIWKALVAATFDAELLYIKPEFESAWEILRGNKDLISKASLYEAYSRYNAIHTILDLSKQDTLFPDRSIAYALLIYYMLKGGLTEEILLELKNLYKLSLDRANIENLPKDDKQRYIEQLKAVADEFDNNINKFEEYKEQADQIYHRIKGE